MKLFLMFAGDLSKRVAGVMREWLPSVIQAVEPFVATEGIDKGARWAIEIGKELDQTHFGIPCLTRDNLEAPWIHFESGAVAKAIDRGYVSPLLVGLRPGEIEGPLVQFQATAFERDEVHRLMAPINRRCGPQALSDQRLQTAFDTWWPQLESAMAPLITESVRAVPKHAPTRSLGSPEVIEEMLDLLRATHKLLNDPGRLLPREYLREYLLEHIDPRGDVRRAAFTIEGVRDSLWQLKEELRGKGVESTALDHLL